MKPQYLISAFLGAAALLTSCENGNNDFPDFDYQTVYFANQYAMRTVELGVDENVELTDDNLHQVKIKAAWGGGYSNKKNVLIDYVVDASLTDGLYFKDSGSSIEVMPSDYYTIDEKQIQIPSGQTMGGVTVHLTDKFFADPKSVTECYVIPLRMTAVTGADSILSGKAAEPNPVLTNDSHWSVQPQNFILYGVKYVNPWHGQYLRRGVDQATINGNEAKIVRHHQYVENDEVVDLSTSAYKEDILPITVKDVEGNNVTVNVRLSFSDDNSCTLSTDDEGVNVSGNGKFVSKGEKKSLGGKDRDAIYLSYTMDLIEKGMKFVSTDTLVLRTRNVYGASAFGIERK